MADGGRVWSSGTVVVKRTRKAACCVLRCFPASVAFDAVAWYLATRRTRTSRRMEVGQSVVLWSLDRDRCRASSKYSTAQYRTSTSMILGPLLYRQVVRRQQSAVSGQVVGGRSVVSGQWSVIE